MPRSPAWPSFLLQHRSQRLALSNSASRWLHILARHYDTPVAVLCRQLRTPRALEQELARLLLTLAERQAAQHLQDDDRPDRDATDVYSRVVYAAYLRQRANRDERECADGNDLLAKLAAEQAENNT